MEVRGQTVGPPSNGRPAISRRSCDQCRARKIGCDRGSPCSNCTSARVDCTHSAVASNPSSARQRVLISAQYERKIDDIANDIDGIKLLLQGLNESKERNLTEDHRLLHAAHIGPPKVAAEHQPLGAVQGEPQWDHSPHTIDFIKAVVQEPRSPAVEQESDGVLKSLESLVHALEYPLVSRGSMLTAAKPARDRDHARSMPPLDAVVAVLRWAKDHAHFWRMGWISHVLRLDTFADICRKVYFAIDDYGEIDFILANGYLAFVFAENVVVSGDADYKEYCCLCRNNLDASLSQLPLLLPTSMEVVAALTLGAFNAIESSKATTAWTFISAAADHCQRLGFHRSRYVQEAHSPLSEAQERLFWVVHRLDKGLSMRLGRSSNIRDDDITLPLCPDEPRVTRLAKLQGKVFDELYSPLGLARRASERFALASAFALDMRGLLNETHADIAAACEDPVSSDTDADPMGSVYPQFELVCHSSLLTFILRAMPDSPDRPGGVSKECLESAREVLDAHEQCMVAVSACKADPFMVTRYISWALMHVPFVPFNILFTHVVQVGDLSDLARMEQFAASIRPEAQTSEQDATVHPHRLYKLLCQAARLYIEKQNVQSQANLTLSEEVSNPLNQFDLLRSSTPEANTADWFFDASDSQMSDLSDWFYDNQQIQGLLDDDYKF